MADKEPEPTRKNKLPEVLGVPGRIQEVTKWQFLGPVKAVKVPPGTKAQHLKNWPGDEQASPWPSWLALAGTAVGFLIAGILVGRFLLP